MTQRSPSKRDDPAHDVGLPISSEPHTQDAAAVSIDGNSTSSGEIVQSDNEQGQKYITKDDDVFAEEHSIEKRNDHQGHGERTGVTGKPTPADEREVREDEGEGEGEVEGEYGEAVEGEEDEELGDEEGEEDEEEDDEEDEPQLKYARLTQYLGPIYRNGDATSAFLVAGDKMIIGTHNGNIHVLQLPTFQLLRRYHAHSASVTGISISPYPPPLPTDKTNYTQNVPAAQGRPDDSPSASSRKAREPPPVPKIPSNDIYIATSSMDGNVCVQSLVDFKDVQLRNFGRPVQTVSLSPDFKHDRIYLSGGLAGQLVLTTGGGQGRTTSTTTGTAAATASGWLGSMGIGNNTKKDTVLHSGEGTISCIKWSLSGKYVVWLNEHGIKIMRSNLHLDTIDAEDGWKRIGHIDRPQTEEWETMASVWKGRAEWIDETAVEADESTSGSGVDSATLPTERLREQAVVGKKYIERLLVGWGGILWIIHVHPGGLGVGRNAGEKTVGRAEIVKILRMDCIISGISLYTQSILLVLSFCTPDDDDEETSSQPSSPEQGKSKNPSQPPTAFGDSGPSGGIRRRRNNLPPELRLIDLDSQTEVDKYSLSISRYERLTASDYHLGVLPARNAASAVASSRGAFEALAGIGTDMWNAAINPRALFNSGASVRSRGSEEGGGAGSRATSTTGTVRPAAGLPLPQNVHPNLAKPGAKIFIHSPYDCVLGTKRDLVDHLSWLLEQQQYQTAWELLDENPDILSAPLERQPDAEPALSSKQQGGMDDRYEDESVTDTISGAAPSVTEKEKRRIGELWIQELIDQGDWTSAGPVCGKVLRSPEKWQKWVWKFVDAKRFNEITDHMPDKPMDPPLPGALYEVILNHYIQTDKLRFKELLDRWPADLFDISIVTTDLENQLKYRDVRESTIGEGEQGRDWRIVMESLARLHEAGGRHREALRYYIKLQDADSAFRLIKDSHLAEAVADDIPSFIGLRVPSHRLNHMTETDLAEATSEAIKLLVDEAQHGLLRPNVVVDQLQARQLHLYLYFYLRGLWNGDGIKEHGSENADRLIMESRAMVDEFADLAVHIFATYQNRALLMDFLKSSTSYAFEKAVQECEIFNYNDELVYLYSKTGQMKKALYLIIDRLNDVYKAIEFAKEQEDPDLWNDLLDYSMDKPHFIRALLEQVGTSIDPITLVRRIPEGLEIDGLREGLTHMMKEHELQHSISSGVARVLRSEVAVAQNELRTGQRRGIKFDVVQLDEGAGDGGLAPNRQPTNANELGEKTEAVTPLAGSGQCAKCFEAFTEYEMETVLGFACGHVFHVSHLLEMLNKGRSTDIPVAGGEEQSNRYLVGMKVMRARLLRDKVRDGCPMCHSC